MQDPRFIHDKKFLFIHDKKFLSLLIIVIIQVITIISV